MGCSSPTLQPLACAPETAIEDTPNEPERRRLRRGDDEEPVAGGRRHRHHRDLRFEHDRPPIADVEMTRRASRGIGDAAQFRTNLGADIGSVLAYVDAGEDKPLVIEEKGRLLVLTEDVRE